MAATAIKDAILEIRDFLVDKQPRKFWSDPELRALYRLGCMDLWGAILDLHAEHYDVITSDSGVVPTIKANATEISNVPDDCFRVLLIEPLDISITGDGRRIIFTPRKYNHPNFVAARTRSALDPGSIGEIFYHMSGVGAPISAPRIRIAPTLSSDLSLRMQYCPTIEIGDFNPIPGQSDNALKAWTIAYALAKEGPQGERVPDPTWLSVYSTEKQLILTRLTPRQEHEPEVVEDFFGGFGHF